MRPPLREAAGYTERGPTLRRVPSATSYISVESTPAARHNCRVPSTHLRVSRREATSVSETPSETDNLVATRIAPREIPRKNDGRPAPAAGPALALGPRQM